MAFSGTQVTRLGIGGGIWRAYGDFSGKTEQVAQEPQGAPPVKARKAREREEQYQQAWDRAKARKDLERAIQAAREAEQKPTKVLLKKKSAAIQQTELTTPEIDQIASIQSELDRALAIEYQLRFLEWKHKRNKALALLLLVA